MQNHPATHTTGAVSVAPVQAPPTSDTLRSLPYTFTLASADIDADLQAQAAQQPLTQMVLKDAGYPASCQDLPATMSALQQTYAHEVAHFPDLLGDPQTMSGLALICARHALAHLAQPFADLDEEDREELICDHFHSVPAGPATQPFWNLLADLLYLYVGPAYEQGWRPAPGVVPADASMSMPTWNPAHGAYVCDLPTFLHPDEDAAEVNEEVTDALHHARRAGTPAVGIRVIPLCGGPARLHLADRSQPAIDMPWRARFPLDLH